jgi:hypothetical protein
MPPTRATSFRIRGRNHLGTPGEIKSEWRATSFRIRGRLRPESAPTSMLQPRLSRNLYKTLANRATPSTTKNEGICESGGSLLSLLETIDLLYPLRRGRRAPIPAGARIRASSWGRASPSRSRRSASARPIEGFLFIAPHERLIQGLFRLAVAPDRRSI